MESRVFTASAAGFSIQAEVTRICSDLRITVTGGEVPHLGTVTTLSGEFPLQTIRFPSQEGRYHKDHVLAEKIATIIRPHLPGNCVIVAGVHIDDITKQQIHAAEEMADTLGEQIAAWLIRNKVVPE
ncbi:MAG: hypothetical protein LIP08_04975 [Bacteroides sp.]|nr:hypothetical protein [Bacteroides sp.]